MVMVMRRPMLMLMLMLMLVVNSGPQSITPTPIVGKEEEYLSLALFVLLHPSRGSVV